MFFDFVNTNDSATYTVRYADDGFRFRWLSESSVSKVYAVGQVTLVTVEPSS